MQILHFRDKRDSRSSLDSLGKIVPRTWLLLSNERRLQGGECRTDACIHHGTFIKLVLALCPLPVIPTQQNKHKNEGDKNTSEIFLKIPYHFSVKELSHDWSISFVFVRINRHVPIG